MTFFSKVLTLNKLHIIENLTSATETGSPQADFFHIGAPIEDPPLLRGSIVLDMNLLFLTDNSTSFHSGSPVDTGSIKFGFFKSDIDTELFLKMLNCGFEKFHTLTTELFSLPASSIEKLNAHKACPSFKPMLEKHFSPTVTNFMYGQENPHAWLFEFCLDKGYRLKAEHINKIHIPNTYMHNPTVRKLRSKLERKIATYNPKYGIEGRNY